MQSTVKRNLIIGYGISVFLLLVVIVLLTTVATGLLARSDRRRPA